MDKISFTSDRHEKYKDYDLLYQNYEDPYSKLHKFDVEIDHPYLPIGLGREIASVNSDLSFGHNINAFIKDEYANNRIDEIIADNEFDVQLSEASLSQGVKGEVICKNYVDNGKSKISFIQPEFYFPIVSPTNQRSILKEIIAIPFTDPLTNQRRLFTETYEPRQGVNGQVEYWEIRQTFEYAGEIHGKELDEPQEFNTKLNRSPLHFIPYQRSGNDFFGESIYKGIIPILDELDHRITTIANVLDKHSNPAVWATSDVFDDDGNLQMRGDNVYEVTFDEGGKRNEVPIGYITWDWNSGNSNFKFIDDVLYKALHYVSPIIPAIYGMDEASQASSKALKVKTWRTQCRITRSHLYWNQAIKNILFVAQQLDVTFGGQNYKPAIPQVDLRINLPVDQLEDAQAEQLKVEAKVTSHKSSISRLNPHMNSKEVEAEWLEIINEQNEVNVQTFMSDMAGFNSNDTTTEDDVDES